MFDTGEIAESLAARRPGHSLPQGLYTSEAAFAFDMEVMFRRTWLMVGFDVELPKPGSWMSAMVGPWPILITRDRGGRLHGFHNTCRHRGARICAPGKGVSSRLVCPYHRWTYELSGELVHAARMPLDFDAGAHSLGPLHVKSVGGVILVCLAKTPPPIDDFQRGLEPPAGAAPTGPRKAGP